MNTIFFLTLQKIVIYIFFFTAGFLLYEKKVVGEDASSSLTQVTTNIFLPLMIFNSIAQNCTREHIRIYGLLVAAGFFLMLAAHLLGNILVKRLGGDKTEQLTNHYSVSVPNFGFLGYPMVLSLFGQEMLSMFTVTMLSMSIYIYCHEMPKWNPASSGNIREYIKKAINLALLANIAGVLYGLSGLPYPSLFEQMGSMGSNCIGPMTMLITGITIGRSGLKNAFSNKKVYLVTFLRLLVIPAFAVPAMYFLCKITGLEPKVMLFVSIFSILPMGLNPIIFAENYGLDGTYGASSALISLLGSMVTLPVWMQLIVRLYEYLG